MDEVDMDTRIAVEEEDIFNFSEHRENIVSRFWDRTKVAIMGTLFVMGEDIETGHFMFMLGMAVDWFQTLSFPFDEGTDFPWNDYYASFFIAATNFQEKNVYMSDTNQLQNLIVYAISLGLVLLNLIIAAIVGYKFSKNQVQNVFLLTFVRWVCNLFTTILYLPLLDQFALISACTLGYMRFQGCPTQLPTAVLAATAISASILFGLLTFVVIASFYDQDPGSDDDGSKPHSRLELLYVIDKAIYTLMFAYFSRQEYMLYLALVMFVFTSTTTVLYILYLPMYTLAIAIRQAQFQSTFLWAIMCLLFAIIQNDRDDGAPIILYYLGNVSTWVLAKYACEWRVEVLEKKNITTISNPYEVELVARYMLLKRFQTLQPEHMKEKQGYADTLREIEALYFKAERKFPESCLLQLLAAQFYLTYYDSHQNSMVKMEKAAKLSPQIDEEFVIYKRKQNAIKNEASDVVTFVTFNTYMQAAHKAEISAMNGQVQFWKELNSDEEPNVDRMMFLSKFITHYTGEANTFYTILMRMNPNDAKLLHSFGIFLMDIINDEEQSTNLLNRAQGLDRSKEKNAANSGYHSDEVRMHLLLSLDKGSFSRIEYASEVALALLKVPKTYIYNEKMERFLPLALAPDFLTFLKRAMELTARKDERRTETAILDGSGFIIFCNCVVRRVTEKVVQRLINEEGGNKGKLMDSREKRIDSSRSSLLTSDREAGGAIDQLHLSCILTPMPESRIALLVDINGFLVHISQAASLLTGISPEMHSKKNINEFVFMYGRYFEEAMQKAQVDEYGNTVPYPINTFFVSSIGKFSRVSITFVNLKLQRNSLILLNVKVLSDFDRNTERFLKIFSNFLKAYFGKASRANFHLSNINMGRIFTSSRGEDHTEQVKAKSTEAKNLFKRMREKVEACNKVFSFELKRVGQIVLVVLVCVMALEIASFVLVDMLFQGIVDNMSDVSTSTNIEYYSLSLSYLTLLLDFARQGAALQPSVDYYYKLINSTLGNYERDLDSIKDVSHLNTLSELNTYLITQNIDWGLEYTLANPVQACFQQIAHARSLVEGPLSGFDVADDPDAFFVYQNGKRAIINSWSMVSKEAERDTRNEKSMQQVYMITFAILQCFIIILGFFLQSPYSLRAENVHFDVISVFFAIPKQVVKFLYDTSKTNFELMKHDNYPDNKVKKMNEEGSDLDAMLIRTVKIKKGMKLDDRRKSLSEHYNSWYRKLVLLLRNIVAQRIMICFVFLLGYILILEVYVGQVLAYSTVEKGPVIVRSIGELKVFLTRASIAQIEVLYNRPEDEIAEPRIQAAMYINNTSIYTINSIEDAHDQCIEQGLKIGLYLNLFRVGNDAISLHYNRIYSLQISEFFSYFFEDGCANIDFASCSTVYGSLMKFGLYDTISVYRRDLEALISQ